MSSWILYHAFGFVSKSVQDKEVMLEVSNCGTRDYIKGTIGLETDDRDDPERDLLECTMLTTRVR